MIEGTQVWSDAGAVYALVSVTCNPLANVSCGGEGTSLYSNKGAGWTPLYRVDPSEATGLTGLPGGPLVVYGNECGITLVDRQGNGTCSWEDSAFEGVRDVFAIPNGTAYALVGERVLKYAGGSGLPSEI